VISIYLSAPLVEAATAREMGDRLAEYGIISCARWIERTVLLGNVVDPQEEGTRSTLLADNMEDIERGAVCVFLASRGVSRAAHWDTSYALFMGKPVVWVSGQGGVGRCLWDSHPGVTRVVETNGASVRQTAARVAKAVDQAVARIAARVRAPAEPSPLSLIVGRAK
jgi:hypothetical protein